MTLKTKYDFTLDTSVAAGATDTVSSDVVPVGKTVRLMVFGGYDPRINDGISSIIGLQWGSGTSWQTVRVGGDGFFNIEWAKGKDFVGDGTKRLRLVRQNKSASAKVLYLWVNAVVL